LQAFALLARNKALKGDYEAALQGFDQQLNIARQLDDRSQQTGAHVDIGLVLTNQGRYPEALPHFEESLTLAKSLGHQKNTCLSLINRANVLWRVGRYREAQADLNQASSIAAQPEAGKSLSSWFSLALARMALSERRLPEAKAKAHQALALAGSQFKGTVMEATYTLGSAQTFSGASREGRIQCENAVTLATASGDLIRLSEALLALSEAMLHSGDAPNALITSLRAQEIFARLGKQDFEWLAWMNAARASRNIADENKTLEYATRAVDLLSGLHQRWGAEYYTGYLNRPDIDFFRKQLSELLR
jgi:tetratricopeptide (TPR) repeat protein